MRRATRQSSLIAAVLLSIGLTAISLRAGTPDGHYAVSLVDRAQYEHVHRDLLFTHNGDNRMWGAQHDLARDNIEALFTAYGLNTALHAFTYGGQTYYNVVAELTGTTRPNDIYIVGAHFDSAQYYVPVPPGVPGADDDATGVAAVLEIARLVSQWPSQATIRFIAFDREEQGGRGSGAYAAEHHSDNILGMVALDMLGFRRTNHNTALIDYCEEASAALVSALASALTDYAWISPYQWEDPHYNSDHAWFAAQGFQAVGLAETDWWSNPRVHTYRDSVDPVINIDYDYAIALTRGALGWLVDAAGVMPNRPPVQAGDTDCDSRINHDDISPFVLALSGQSAYEAAYPNCHWLNADCNGDGVVNFADINPFVDLLLRDCDGPQVAAKLLPADGMAGAWFGAAVALSGNTALVGAPYDSALGSNAGAAYVFQRARDGWAGVCKLTAADAEPNDAFGLSLAVWGDTALIGARGHDAAYVFERTDIAWTQVARLVAPDAGAGSRFGQAVALSGATAIIGAPYDSAQGQRSGSAYVFERIEGAWTQAAKLLPADGSRWRQFGSCLGVSGDTVAVGAPGTSDPGTAYVFERMDGAWRQAAKLTDMAGHACSVAVSGNTIAVGTSAFGGTWGAYCGAYVFERVDGVWAQVAMLGSSYGFGSMRVALDEGTCVVGVSMTEFVGDELLEYFNRYSICILTRQAGVWSLGPWFDAWLPGIISIAEDTIIVGAPNDDVFGAWSGSADVIDLHGAGVPSITQQPRDETVQLGEYAAFLVTAIGPSRLMYEWQKDGLPLADGGNISGTATPRLTIHPVTADDAGLYNVVVTSPCGSTASATATLTVSASDHPARPVAQSLEAGSLHE